MKKTIIISLSILLLITLSSCSKSENKTSKTTNLTNKTNNVIPTTPPGFSLPSDLGELEISDYTNSVEERLKSKIKYSAIWTIDSNYSKKWENMTQKEKSDFKNLRKTTFDAVKNGVEQAGGEIEFKKFVASGMNEKDSADLYGGEKIDGEWKVKYPQNNSIAIWWVKITSAETSPRISEDNYGIPYLNVYISHTEL